MACENVYLQAHLTRCDYLSVIRWPGQRQKEEASLNGALGCSPFFPQGYLGHPARNAAAELSEL